MNIKVILISLSVLLLILCRVGVAEQDGWNIQLDQSGISFGQQPSDEQKLKSQQQLSEDPDVNPYAKPEYMEDPDYMSTQYESMEQPHYNTQSADDWHNAYQKSPQSDQRIQQNQHDMQQLNPQSDPRSNPRQQGGSEGPSFRINFGN